jgi:hypothetical protein
VFFGSRSSYQSSVDGFFSEEEQEEGLKRREEISFMKLRLWFGEKCFLILLDGPTMIKKKNILT